MGFARRRSRQYDANDSILLLRSVTIHNMFALCVLIADRNTEVERLETVTDGSR
jgi:hypothetical protein